MTLKQTIYLSLSAAAMIIGLYRVLFESSGEPFLQAVGYNYWIFMVALVLLMLFRYDKKKQKS